MTRRGTGCTARRAARLLAATLSLAVFPAALGDGRPAAGEAGKRIYREGVLPSGEEVGALVRGDVPLSGAPAACVNCHRRSGMGSVEGNTVVRPLAAEALFNPAEVYPAGSFDAPTWLSRQWPPYTDASLARAIRDGIDPDGRPLDPVMPRYALGDADMALLVSYLKTLTVAGAPGISENVLRFATIVDGRVDPARQAAMLDVLHHFFTQMSAGTRNEAGRAAAPVPQRERKSRAYRKMELDTWALTGPEESWGPQIEAYYRKQPVFALVSGISAAGWGPVQRFSERFEVPCLFPNVDLPPLSEADYYTIYFSRGLTLEAEVLARHLENDRDSLGDGPVVQVYQEDEAGKAMASAFQAAWTAAGGRGLRERRIEKGEALTGHLWRELLEAHHPSAMVLWLRNPDLSGLDARGDDAAFHGRVYLSAGLGAGPASPLPAFLRDRAYLVDPFALPGDEETRLRRTRTWLRAGKIAAADERLQVNTFFAVSMASHAFERLLGYDSRDYFLERVEHMAEDSVLPTAYPRVSLGPGQRYASKGGYILRFPDAAGKAMLPVGGWIVP